MKQSDCKVLISLALKLAYGFPKLHRDVINDFVLGLHSCSIKINTLSLSIKNIEPNHSSKLEEERSLAVNKAIKYCRGINQNILATYGDSEGRNLALFNIRVNFDPERRPLQLTHPQWENQGIAIPCSR